MKSVYRHCNGIKLSINSALGAETQLNSMPSLKRLLSVYLITPMKDTFPLQSTAMYEGIVVTVDDADHPNADTLSY